MTRISAVVVQEIAAQPALLRLHSTDVGAAFQLDRVILKILRALKAQPILVAEYGSPMDALKAVLDHIVPWFDPGYLLPELLRLRLSESMELRRLYKDGDRSQEVVSELAERGLLRR